MLLDHLKEEEEYAHEELERAYNDVNGGKKRVHDWTVFLVIILFLILESCKDPTLESQ